MTEEALNSEAKISQNIVHCMTLCEPEESVKKNILNTLFRIVCGLNSSKQTKHAMFVSLKNTDVLVWCFLSLGWWRERTCYAAMLFTSLIYHISYLLSHGCQRSDLPSSRSSPLNSEHWGHYLFHSKDFSYKAELKQIERELRFSLINYYSNKNTG